MWAGHWERSPLPRPRDVRQRRGAPTRRQLLSSGHAPARGHPPLLRPLPGQASIHDLQRAAAHVPLLHERPVFGGRRLAARGGAGVLWPQTPTDQELTTEKRRLELISARTPPLKPPSGYKTGKCILWIWMKTLHNQCESEPNISRAVKLLWITTSQLTSIWHVSLQQNSAYWGLTTMTSFMTVIQIFKLSFFCLIVFHHAIRPPVSHLTKKTVFLKVACISSYHICMHFVSTDNLTPHLSSKSDLIRCITFTKYDATFICKTS